MSLIKTVLYILAFFFLLKIGEIVIPALLIFSGMLGVWE